MTDLPSIPIIILASGSSSRFGGIKQLAKVQDEGSMVRIACTSAISCTSDVVVVLGANAELISDEIADLDVHVTHNPNWEMGMSSSLKSGLDYVMRQFKQAESVLVTLVDIPEVREAQLRILIETARSSPDRLVTASYDGVVGVPAVFPKRYWSDIQSLEGDKGARNILRRATDIIAVDMPEAGRDVDRPKDLR